MRRNYRTTYSVVVHRTGEVLRSKLSRAEAHTVCRDWNSRATTETWAWVRSDGQTKAIRFQIDLMAGLPRLVEGVPVDDQLGALWEPNVSDHPGYLPTPAQIAAECAAIQSEWSELERISRESGIDSQTLRAFRSTQTLKTTAQSYREPRRVKCHLPRKGGRAA